MQNSVFVSAVTKLAFLEVVRPCREAWAAAARRLVRVNYLVALLPSIGVGILFYIVIRALVNADRNERAALKRLDEEDARKAASPDQP